MGNTWSHIKAFFSSGTVRDERALRSIGAPTADELFTIHLATLCNDLMPSEVIVQLTSTKVITHIEADDIRAEKTEYKQNQKLISLVMKRGPAGQQAFITALEQTEQKHLANLLTQTQSTADSCSQVERVRAALQNMYLKCFKTTNPFSLPFTFDIEQTWVSLALKNEQHANITDDYTEIMKRAFSDQIKMLIVEGEPASGKTSLMRRIAYDWAKGDEDLKKYDVLLYAEFRSGTEKNFESISEMVIAAFDSFFGAEKSEMIESLNLDHNFFESHRVLMLLDGYDESSKDQCKDLENFISKTIMNQPLLFDVIISTRPGYLSKYRGQRGRFVFASILGFTKEEQKHKYISNHFSALADCDPVHIQTVQQLLKSNANLNTLAETPLFLTFICLVHEKITEGTLLELYRNIVWWLLDRHQKDFPERDVPNLFEFEVQPNLGYDKIQIIQDEYFHFPQLHFLGEMALKLKENNNFSSLDLNKHKIKKIIHQVGLLRKNETRENHRRKTEFSFPHRTIQEFFAAFFLFYSSESFFEENVQETINALQCNIDFNHAVTASENNKLQMTEFEKFIFRMVSERIVPFNETRQKDFCGRFTVLALDLGIFLSNKGITSINANYCFENCSNLIDLTLYTANSATKLILNEILDLSKMKMLKHFFLDGLQIKVTESTEPLSSKVKSFVLLPQNVISIIFKEVTFYSAKLFCDTMEYLLVTLIYDSTLKFVQSGVLEIEETYQIFSVSTAMESLSKFSSVKSDTNIFECKQINKALKFVSCATKICIKQNRSFASYSFEGFSNLSELDINSTVMFGERKLITLTNLTVSESITLNEKEITAASFTSQNANFSALRKLKFRFCTVMINALPISTKMSRLRTLEFDNCEIDLTAWQSITEGIRSSSVQCLMLDFGWFNKENVTEYSDYLNCCLSVEVLKITPSYVTGTVLDFDSFQNKITDVLKNLARKMNQLKRIEVSGTSWFKLNENNARRIEKVGRTRMRDFVVAS